MLLPIHKFLATKLYFSFLIFNSQYTSVFKSLLYQFHVHIINRLMYRLTMFVAQHIFRLTIGWFKNNCVRMFMYNQSLISKSTFFLRSLIKSIQHFFQFQLKIACAIMVANTMVRKNDIYD